MRVNGSIDSGGIQFMAPEIVEGCHFHLQCDSMHQHALLWGPPMTPGSLVAGGFPAGSLITPSGIWLHWC